MSTIKMTRGVNHTPDIDKATNTHRILCALNERERSFFLPDIKANSFPGAECQWLDTRECPEEVWAETLQDFNPTVLVSCWSTSRLPLDYVENPHRALNYVCNITGSVRQTVSRRFLELGGLVSNWGDMAGKQVAEHALLLALGALREVGSWRSYIESVDGSLRYQAAELGTRTLFGRRVGLHGFGRIARALVVLLKPFGVDIRAYSRQVPETFLQEHGVLSCASIEDLFSNSEVLFECEALTPESLGSVTAAILARLPDDAVFVNIGRGAVVDEVALLAEASRLRLALDVVTQEPLASASPFFTASRTLLSPHIGGPTFDHYRACGEMALANLRRFLRGDPIKSKLTLELFDRST